MVRRITLSLALCASIAAFGVEKASHNYFTTADGVKIHYMVQGKGTPVILIHGYTGSAEGNWFRNGIADALAVNHRVIALDCRNHGRSDKPQPGGPDRAEDVIELMDHLKIPKAHFHGYSMGGAIVGRLLALIPDRFITAGFGGSGIRETDPAWIAKVPPDKEGRDPQEDEASRNLRIRRAMDLGMSREEAEKRAAEPAPARTAGAAIAPSSSQSAAARPTPPPRSISPESQFRCWRSTASLTGLMRRLIACGENSRISPTSFCRGNPT
jgi:pimeloyl-ACP methyl ester carboxylesterase